MNDKNPTLGYLSAAPRVSTRPDAELGGARSHVLGVVQAFEALGWAVKPFIVGDRVPRSWTSRGSEQSIGQGGIRTLAADLIRLGMGFFNTHVAWKELGEQVDWIYERNASLQSLGGIFQRHGIPWILETNAPLFYEAKQERGTVVLSSLARHLETKAYRNCDVLVCISEELKDIIVQETGISSKKVVVMANGVDVELFDPKKYQPKRVFDGFTIGFVGTLYAWQKIDLLLDVLYDLDEDGLSLNLVIVGDGAAKSELEIKMRELNLESQVKFVGQVSRYEVPGYIAGFDIGYSGQGKLSIGAMYLSPLKLYEYMAMAKPVIASDFEDAQNIVLDGQTGYLFHSEDKDSLKENLLRAYQDRDFLAEMGHSARREIVEHHSWTSRVSNLIQAVENIL